MKKIFLSLLLILILISCTAQNEARVEKFSVFDALSREVSFSDYPERIIIAGKQTPTIANFFYLFSDKSDRLIAVENRSQSPDIFLSLVDKDYQSKLILEKGAGVEQIAPFEPDLVVLKTSMKDEIGKGLEEVGIPVVYVSFENVEQIYSDIRVLGKLLESSERAEEIISEYQKEYLEINDRLFQTDKTPSVLLIQATTSDNGFSFQIPSSDWLQTKMIENLGAIPIWKNDSLSGGWTEVNIEQIIGWNPDIVMLINYQGKSLLFLNELMANPIWQQFINENEVELEAFPYDFTSWDQPDTRWILGYAWMAGKLYPNEYSTEELVKKIKNFYTYFYQMKGDSIEREINPIISAYL